MSEWGDKSAPFVRKDCNDLACTIVDSNRRKEPIIKHMILTLFQMELYSVSMVSPLLVLRFLSVTPAHNHLLSGQIILSMQI
jgi:hypothetical protein